MAEIKSRIASGRYALLHLAGWGHPLLWRTLLFARRRIPVTVQSDTPAPRGEPTWRRLAKRMLYGALFRVPAMFTPAGTPQAEYIRSFGVSASRIRIARLAVDVEAIQKVTHMPGRRTAVRARLELTPDCVAILYVGRLEPHKGIDDMMGAFAELVRVVPHVMLLIAGDGTLRGRIARAAAAMPSVRYLGRLTGDDLWEAYAAADIAVVPSRFEPWGLVVNEAMAAGLPIIVSDCVGSAADLVREGSTGIVVPTACPSEFTRAMAELCMQPELRRSMGRRAREAIAPWTPANQAAHTVAAWRDALAA
jgi:glycosyltransferase involved in cell wall biosynthesis